MHRFTAVVKSVVVTLTLAMLGMGAMCGAAQAGAIPYSVIGTNEFNLPIKYDPFNVLLSYNLYRDEGKAWDRTTGTSRDSLMTIEKFAHFFKFDALPDVGFLWEAVGGVGHFSGKGHDSSSGVLDPSTGMLAWIKPTPNLTTGIEYFIYLPFGDSDLSSHSVDNSVALTANYNQGRFMLDGDVGVKIRGDYRHGGNHYEQGDTLFANMVATVKIFDLLQPMGKIDFQTTSGGKDKDTGAALHNSQRELALGIGNHFNLTKKLSGDIWYAHGVTGSGVTKTNSALMRLVYVF